MEPGGAVEARLTAEDLGFIRFYKVYKLYKAHKVYKVYRVYKAYRVEGLGFRV